MLPILQRFYASNIQVDDKLLLRLAAASARSECAALRTAALRAPTLAAPAAVLCGGKGASSTECPAYSLVPAFL